MKKGKTALLILAVIAVMGASAYAATDYLWAYSSWVSAPAMQSALEYTPPVELSEEEMSIFRLGYACGYDSAKQLDSLISLPGDGGSGGVITRPGIPFASENEDESEEKYIVNTESNKFHKPGCSAEKQILPEHRREIFASFETMREMGYSPCGICLKNKRK